MSEPPEVVKIDDGMWVRRDVFVDSLSGEEADAEAALDELIDDDVFESMCMAGYEYVRGTSRSAMVKQILSGKASLASDRIRNRAADVVGWGDDT